MRKALIMLATVAALAACGGGGEPRAEAADTVSPSSSSSSASSTSKAPTSPSPAPSPALSPEMRQQVFVTFLEGQGFIPTYSTAEVAVDLAGALCGRYDDGASYEDVVGVLLAAGIPAFEAGGFEGAAVTAFCPEHAGKRTGQGPA
jgi:predicted small lipoprotein YifL